MNFKDSIDNLVDDFKAGKKDVDMTYKVGNNDTVEIINLSFHKPYEWDGKKEPAYISFNAESKSIGVSSLSYIDLKDPTLKKFFGLPEEFGEI